ncbi:MAG TPA: MopE-related protein, partial [Myxococcota bacterium]|nr:MopE-related protein [Myxococcota bacterium]
TDPYEVSGLIRSYDCDDFDSGDYPGATETTGNGDDEDCDGAEICYDDDDNDGYLDSTGDTRSSTDTDCSDANEGTSTDPVTDCDDADSGDHPGAAEIVGNLDDEDCDGGETCFDDDDDDNYIDTSGDTRLSTDLDCGDAYEVGLIRLPGTDCNDSSALYYPNAPEPVCERDYNCDGVVAPCGPQQ